jgi:DNA-binding transcriptional MerR regulator
MNFKEATDSLLNRIDHAKLAEALGVSIASIRQARLSPSAKAHREAPEGWKNVIMRLAKKQANQYQRLAERLEQDER